MGAVASSNQFNDQQTNRLGANEVASLRGVKPAEFAEIIGASPGSLRRRPLSKSLQGSLAQLAHAWNELETLFPDDQAIRDWMRHPIKRLRGQTPLWLLQEHGVSSFCALVAEMIGGAYA